MRIHILGILGLAFIWTMSTGLIVKEEDPILDTKTDPIKWEKKDQEIREGKAPTTHSIRYYKQDGFFAFRHGDTFLLVCSRSSNLVDSREKYCECSAFPIIALNGDVTAALSDDAMAH